MGSSRARVVVVRSGRAGRWPRRPRGPSPRASRPPARRGVDDAVAHVLLEQAEGDRLQRLRHRRDLGEDVDAVLLLLDHPLQAAGLALDAAQPLEVVVLAVDVAVLVLVRAAPSSTVSMSFPSRARSLRRARRNHTPLGFICPAAGGARPGAGWAPA